MLKNILDFAITLAVFLCIVLFGALLYFATVFILVLLAPVSLLIKKEEEQEV